MQSNQCISVKKENTRMLKNGWIEIKLSFIAAGKEKYFLLGNFDKMSNKEILESAGQNLKYIEYYVDNISVKPIDGSEMKCFDYKQRMDSLYASNSRHTSTKKEEEEAPNDSVITQTTFIPKGDTIVLGTINFNFDSDVLVNSKSIEKYFDSLDISMISKVYVVGYTDSIGSKSYNLNLSERRALSVRNFLINMFKISENLVIAEGKGITTDKYFLGENRRVELIIYKKQ